MIAVEIKSSLTMHNEYFDGLIKFKEISQENVEVKKYVIYAGDLTQERNPGMMIFWVDFGDFTHIL